MYDQNNVFAKIIRGEIPSDRVYENEYAVAFRDVNPVATIHVLIVPRGQYTNILDFTKNASVAEQQGFWDAFNKTVEILGITDNCNVLANVGCGVICGQSVPHYHLHLIAGEQLKTWEEFTA